MTGHPWSSPESAAGATGALDGAFETALSGPRARASVSILFSGGVDSGLLAWELRAHPNLRLVTVGLEGAHDLRVAQESAAVLGLPWSGHTLRIDEVLDMRDRLRRWEGPRTPVKEAVETALALALKAVPDRYGLCGQGADELFFGYDHYRRAPATDAAARGESDLREVVDVDWPRTQRIAARLGRSVEAPFLAPDFVATARAIPMGLRISPHEPKSFFRRWAIRRGLPSSIALRPKKALQYGSGVERLLRRRGPEP
jgi:asparagine synthase (glutamine-hydrolysing)